MLTTAEEVEERRGLLERRVERYVAFDRVNRPYANWQMFQFRPFLGPRILEIGCGVGGMIDLLGPRESIVGLEIEDDVRSYAQQRFADRPECRILSLNIEQISRDEIESLKAQRFDSLLCINVLEHLRDDIGALLTMGEILEPGGRLALLVPAHLTLYGPYDRLDGHYRRYTKAYLRLILSHTPLEILRLYYFNAVGAVGWFVQHRLLRQTIHGAGHFSVMNALLPMVRPLERLVAPPFGLSLIAVCRRHES